MNQITDVIGVVKGVKDLSDVVQSVQQNKAGMNGNGGRGRKNGRNTIEDGENNYSDVYDYDVHPAASKSAQTSECYLSAMHHMRELTWLQWLVERRKKIDKDTTRRIAEALYTAL